MRRWTRRRWQLRLVCAWARSPALSALGLRLGSLRARRVDVVANRAIAFVAVVLPPLVAVIETERIAHGVRLHHDHRILDLHLVENRVVIQPREPLRRLHLVADGEAIAGGRSEDADIG